MAGTGGTVGYGVADASGGCGPVDESEGVAVVVDCVEDVTMSGIGDCAESDCDPAGGGCGCDEVGWCGWRCVVADVTDE